MGISRKRFETLKTNKIAPKKIAHDKIAHDKIAPDKKARLLVYILIFCL